MPTTSPQGLSRQKLQALAQTVFAAQSPPLDTTRIKLGLHDVSDNVEFISTLSSAGPYLMILPAVTEPVSATEKIVPFKVEAQLWYATASDQDYDFLDVEEILFGTSGIVKKWADHTQYTSSPPALHVEATGPEIRSDLTPIAFVYLITADFEGSY